MVMYRTILVVFIMVILSGCKDKAKDGYERCLEREKSNDMREAYLDCNLAALLDPTSKSGVAAAQKAAQLKPGFDKIMEERNAKDRAAQQAAQASALLALRMKIHRSPTFSEENDHCSAEGKPGHSYRYGGGTYDENESLAYSEGCVAYDQRSVSVSGHAQNHFCCP